MSVSYQGILTALKAVFGADSRTSEHHVFIEQEPQIGLQDYSAALLLTLSRRNPSLGQPMAAGKRTRYALTFSVWVISFSAESFEKAAEVRDTLLEKAERVLMDNRTISGTVESLQLEGGDFFNARSDVSPAFCAMAEIVVQAQVSAINV